MPLNLQPPITYLITSGKMQSTTTRSVKFAHLPTLIESAVGGRHNLIQIRKGITARVYELVLRAVARTGKSYATIAQ